MTEESERQIKSGRQRKTERQERDAHTHTHTLTHTHTHTHTEREKRVGDRERVTEEREMRERLPVA